MKIISKEFSANIRKNVKTRTRRLLQQLSLMALTKASGGKNDALLWSYGQVELSPFLFLKGFLQGIYPLPNMTDGKVIEWYDPEIRGIIPLQNFKLHKDLQRRLKKEKFQESEKKFEVRINTAFEKTIMACAQPRGQKTKTWLTPEYIKTALELHKMGFMHSVETYQNKVLVGGVIGIAINGHFSSLTLFHTVDNASKIAFYYLLVKLRADGFMLHDIGAASEWFRQYGLIALPRNDFHQQLVTAIISPVKFTNHVPVLEF
ncbi:leucyl/phenylalanyl-tRNA--protein transferase [Pedobacter immunditicola]|uniref:leucyl/phenylalanyl-tRNA--protein transferase n=1 Tax=Pedobacter immunditicola TaxID=3133440 RepID=UPI00309E5386